MPAEAGISGHRHMSPWHEIPAFAGMTGIHRRAGSRGGASGLQGPGWARIFTASQASDAAAMASIGKISMFSMNQP